MSHSKEKKKIAVGLSGGVDSAVAAHLLQEQGHDVTAFYLQCWDFDRPGCGGDSARNDAIHVATELGLKFQHLEFIEEYEEKIIQYFYSEYKAGRTPNPDILCNSMIKFGIFLEWALKEGFDFVATGHYARLEENPKAKCINLLSGKDKTKDQSYFLYRLNQNQLQKIMFPLGTYLKEDVRATAKKLGLRIHNKPDSVGICFIGEVDIREFLQERIDAKQGQVTDTSGNVIGTHEGAWFYTIGQRHGFNITKYQGVPLYVVAKDVEKNLLVVGPKEEVTRSRFLVEDLHWICEEPEIPFKAAVRIRNLGDFHAAEISAGTDSGKLQVTTEEELFGLAPGQSAVFYDGEKVLGGGIISG
ncbi:tRNA 2-thiouridine(34) synthase MnmA [candidate division WWE3 bacterium]|nr:tRNA 2-thiouridine(34) synthase MnmA [candidate division WWE3 bacterium]